jgi:hypothetical protein
MPTRRKLQISDFRPGDSGNNQYRWGVPATANMRLSKNVAARFRTPSGLEARRIRSQRRSRKRLVQRLVRSLEWQRGVSKQYHIVLVRLTSPPRGLESSSELIQVNLSRLHGTQLPVERSTFYRRPGALLCSEEDIRVLLLSEMGLSTECNPALGTHRISRHK